MKYGICFILALVILKSCSPDVENEERQYKSELFFKLVSFGVDVFTIENEKEEGICNDTLLTKSERALKMYSELLKKNDLLGRSYFHISSSWFNDEYKTVYVSDDDFQYINEFNLSELRENNQKVIIEFYGESIANTIIKCDSIKSVKVVNGKTKWVK